MIRHVVAFRFNADADTEAREKLVAGLEALPGQVEDIRRYEFGPDAGLAEGNFDFVVVADFEDEAAYGRYAAHPAHVALIRDRIRPFISERVAVQYRVR
jgi:hypothetical protein